MPGSSPAVTFLVGLLTAGVRAAPGVLIVPLEHEFGWSPATISFAVGINLLLYGLVGPFAAAVMDRFGVRRTMTLALVISAAAVALSPAMRQAWQLVLLWGVVVGIEHRRHRRLSLGLYRGALVSPPPGAGGRAADRRQCCGAACFPAEPCRAGHPFRLAGDVVGSRGHGGGLCPAGRAFDARPAARPGAGAVWRAKANRSPRQSRPETRSRSPLARSRNGAGKRDFWLIAGGYFVCGATTNGLIGTHLIPACVDHGLSEVAGAGLLAAAGVFSFLGGTLSGWLSDRCDNRLLLAWYYGLRGLALMYLPFAFGMSIYGLPLFAVFYGLDWIASVPPTVRLLNRVVGTEKTGIMVAWITVIHQFGGALAAYLGGVSRGVFGTYLEAFMVAGLLLIGAALMVLFIGVGGREPEPVDAALAAQ